MNIILLDDFQVDGKDLNFCSPNVFCLMFQFISGIEGRALAIEISRGTSITWKKDGEKNNAPFSPAEIKLRSMLQMKILPSFIYAMFEKNGAPSFSLIFRLFVLPTVISVGNFMGGHISPDCKERWKSVNIYYLERLWF
ncbi:hypothetical protein CDAR_509361 [Caerostris darwini]|uniref:Uncharacterized protein n=1 Tax=Caerostris darwini TaxID=1538125 RepID=A0AAV4UUT4_9ARAC|nr:hypothetical protein CDAR_509361 [Caerostris darwini]